MGLVDYDSDSGSDAGRDTTTAPTAAAVIAQVSLPITSVAKGKRKRTSFDAASTQVREHRRGVVRENQSHAVLDKHSPIPRLFPAAQAPAQLCNRPSGLYTFSQAQSDQDDRAAAAVTGTSDRPGDALVHADQDAPREDSAILRAFQNDRGRRHRRPSNEHIVIHDYNVDEVAAAHAQSHHAQDAPTRARFISGGRHQLSSLLNAAIGQNDALTEQFARDKQRKRESGRRYGF